MQSQKGLFLDKNILAKAARYCAYQERTQAEVRQRLAKWQVYGELAEEIIAQLILEDFINEERYAKAFVGGKFRVKKWGRSKIQYTLQQKGLSRHSIEIGMKEIESELYKGHLKAILSQKKKETDNDFKERQRLYLFAYSKGYEKELIAEVLEEIFERNK